MAKSLQEQMLKMGLVDKQRAQKLKKEKSKKGKQQRNTKQPVQDQNKKQAQQALLQKKEKDRELNLQQKEQADQKAINAQIQQLIKTNRLPDEKEGEPFNFTEQKKIKTIYITAQARDKISTGRLAIVKFKNQYSVVPSEVAEKLAQKDRNIIILLNDKKDDGGDKNDPYADFQIPDDLQW
ncbi:MAG: DUF2058 domain-containing protein [Gammaproteobacteria bacterium]